ncbi:MAG: LysR family transcriptional regulator [Roseovarius sp.]|uniref:LysR family transcriptional regulator n=1 Tax=Roseovarius sp. TaxID=1486281 RepID=UPI0032EF7A73
MPDPSLTVLRALKSLRDTGSVSRTAAELGLTQSAVSRAITGYEQATGLTLLRRDARPLTLTEAGEVIVGHATDIDRSLAALAGELAALRQNRAGTLRIGSFGPTASTRILPDLLSRFRKTHPRITVSIKEGPDDTTRETFSKGLTDVAVLSDPVDDLDALPIATDRLVALLPDGHPLTARPAVSPGDLAATPFIMTLAGNEPAILDWFRQAGLRPDTRHRVQQTHSILALVGSGQGAAIVASLSLPQDVQGVRIVPLAPNTERQVYLVKTPGTPRSNAVTAFWDFAQGADIDLPAPRAPRTR